MSELSVILNFQLKLLTELKVVGYRTEKAEYLTEVDIKYPEASVTRVSQIRSQVAQYGAVPITFPGELQVGMNMTEESIINLFGETNHKKTINNDGYITSTFKYVAKEDDLKSNFFEIELVNGVVTELTLDHRG